MEEEKDATMEEGGNEKKGGRLKLFSALLIVLAVFVLWVMYTNSKKLVSIDLGNIDTSVKGVMFVKTNQILIEQACSNWLPNDLFWPTVLLDNVPNFQIGELEALRYNVRILRDNLSRMRTTDKIDPIADKAFNALSNDPYRWVMPSAESKLRLAGALLDTFSKNLLEGKSHFYPRFDNLIQLLEQYASIMGGVNTKLINASHNISKLIPLDNGATNVLSHEKTEDLHVPWSEIDDNFYYAQGVSFVLYESFKAIRVDFKDILKDNNALGLVDSIISELGACNFEPLVIMNGDIDSIFANHCMNLSSIFNDARQKVNSLISILKQG